MGIRRVEYELRNAFVLNQYVKGGHRLLTIKEQLTSLRM